jgi:hypothetical protein
VLAALLLAAPLAALLTAVLMLLAALLLTALVLLSLSLPLMPTLVTHVCLLIVVGLVGARSTALSLGGGGA